ncbi:MAG: helix-turn-helix domain-containing protein [Gemmataceae bacterium]|nr:helix-turn-helix domain-containing protein [Gemmataceae bacterium]
MDLVRTMVPPLEDSDGEASPLLITADEVARLLNLSKRTLWRLLSAGKLPAPVRLGNAVRWRREEIRQWISQGCPGNTTSPNQR